MAPKKKGPTIWCQGSTCVTVEQGVDTFEEFTVSLAVDADGERFFCLLDSEGRNVGCESGDVVTVLKAALKAGHLAKGDDKKVRRWIKARNV